ncbi:hypothetical protein Droror1_Dr00004510 [Drosera rotundifolia]
MTLEGGTSQACAACKYQRRKCTPECPLAPYFPTDQPKMFQNAHRLFGVSNICKMLERLPDASLKNEAMASIIYEANVWDKYPINGCMEIINQLQVQIYCCVEQLHVINSTLAAYRHQTQQQQMLPLDSDAQLQLGMAFPANDNMPVVYHHPCIGDDGLNSVSLNHSCSGSNNPDNNEKDNICNDVLYIGQDYNQQLPCNNDNIRQSYIESK